MNFFKLLVLFILLLFGSFAQRFQRHLINGTQNGLINGNTEMDSLLSDEEIYEQYGDHLKFVENGEVELELKYNELRFQFCSDGCMGKTVIACYDSSMPNPHLKGICRSGQCEFRAAVEESYGTSFMWFNSRPFNRFFNKDNDICSTAIIKIPEVIPDGFKIYVTCDPLKHNGNVVKLYIYQATYGCPLYVLNAKKWVPSLTTTFATQNLTELSQTTTKTSEANTTLWIVFGVGIFIIFAVIIIGFGYCCYRTQIQKKPLFGKKNDVQQKAFIPKASKKANVYEKKTADEKEVVAKPEPSKEETVAKEKQPKPAKKKLSKEKKAPVVVPNPSKEVTQENGTKEDAQPKKNVSIEPTLEAPTTEASVVQKSVVQQKQKQPGNPPRVFVPKKVILPATKSINGPKSKSHSNKNYSLSGRHEIGMQIMVVSSLDTENDETQNSTRASEKLRKKEPAGGRKKGSKKRQ